MLIRKLLPTDYAEYLSLVSSFRPTMFTETQYNEVLDQMTSSKMTEIWVVEDHGQLVATGTIIYETKFIFNITKIGHIEDVCVKEIFRKKKYGTVIVKHLLEQAKINRCYKVTLDCAEQTSKFYESCGMEKRGVQMSYLLYDPQK